VRAFAASGAILLVAIGVGACSRADGGAPAARAGDAGPVFDLETMAFLSKARALHHEANVKEEAGDARGAAAEVERIVRAAVPHAGAAVIPEVEEVLADAWARLAELDVRLGDTEGAERAAKEGLSHAREPTYFRGHLLEVEGIAQESRGAALADAGDGVGAASARRAAMRLLEEAVAVQDGVIAGALDAGATGRP
jgi:hypothetical protein